MGTAQEAPDPQQGTSNSFKTEPVKAKQSQPPQQGLLGCVCQSTLSETHRSPWQHQGSSLLTPSMYLVTSHEESWTSSPSLIPRIPHPCTNSSGVCPSVLCRVGPALIPQPRLPPGSPGKHKLGTCTCRQWHLFWPQPCHLDAIVNPFYRQGNSGPEKLGAASGVEPRRPPKPCAWPQAAFPGAAAALSSRPWQEAWTSPWAPTG